MANFNTSVSFRVYGVSALFTDPISRDSENKDTYLVPTRSALLGICKRIYNNPKINWRIAKVRVLHEIETSAKGMTNYFYKIQGSRNNKTTYNNYLVNVAYEVKAYIVRNKEHKGPFNPLEHLARIKKSLQVGGYQQSFLGSSENFAYIEKCNFGEEESFYDDSGELDFGLMFSHYKYDKKDNIAKIFFMDTFMYDGVIYYPKEEDCLVRHLNIIPSEDDMSIGSIEDDMTILSLEDDLPEVLII